MTKENLLKTPPIVSLANFQRVQMLRRPRVKFNWLSVSFFDYWLISMSGFLLFLHRISFCFKSLHFPNQRGGYTKKKNNQSDLQAFHNSLKTITSIMFLKMERMNEFLFFKYVFNP